MIRNCPNCRKLYETSKTAGLCPHCGTSPRFSGIALSIIVFVAVFLLVAGLLFLYRPLSPSDSSGDPGGPPVPFEAPPTELPAAGVTVRPPSGWLYKQSDATSIAFSCIDHASGSGAVRFCVVDAVQGTEAHMELFRKIVPTARAVQVALPEWPGAEALAVRVDGDPRLGASWLIPRGKVALQVVFWGDEALVRDIDEFRKRLILGAPPQ